MSNIIDVVKTRADSWVNALTGLGNAMRDKLMATRFLASRRLSDTELENLYHDEDMAARVCEAQPEEALRKGFFLSTSEGDDQELNDRLTTYGKRLEFNESLEDCAVWSRVYGGAGIYLGVDDGSVSEEEPLNEENIKAINFAMVLDKRSLSPAEYYDDPDNDDKFGQVKTYRLNAQTDDAARIQTNVPKIHESRIIRMDGSRTSNTRKAKNDGWSESVLQKVNDVLTQFNTGWQSTGHLLQDAAQGVFKLHGLVDMIASGDKDTLQNRMEVVEMGRSVARAIMLDAETEDFHREAYNFAGVPDILHAFILRFASAARMPVMVLMGQSPSGMNATGEGDIRLWYDRVQAYQTQDLAKAIERFWTLVFAAADFEGEAPENWTIKFERLWQMTDSEQAELEKKVAEKDKIYMDSGVILPEEVGLNRWTSRGFSMETKIDTEAREEMLDAEIELAKSKAGEEPEPPPMPGQPAPEPDPSVDE